MKKMIELEEALKEITNNLDRLNGFQNGVMDGVAMDWLRGVPVIEVEEE